jgi:hypothetical protein
MWHDFEQTRPVADPDGPPEVTEPERTEARGAGHAQDIRTRMAAIPFAGLLDPTTPAPAPRCSSSDSGGSATTGALGRSPNIRGLGRGPRPTEMAASLE